MKRILCILSLAAAVVALSACGGSTSGKGAKGVKGIMVSLDELDDYFTVKSCSIESNAEQVGIDNLKNVKGTVTIVLTRNKQEMKYKPSDVEDAQFKGDASSSYYAVFHGDCEAAIKKILKMEPGSEETLALGFKVEDPYYQFRSDEENQSNRQNIYDALTTPGGLDQVLFDITFSGELEELRRTIKDLLDDD